jgi:Tol biopolymer transport system component
MGGKPTNSDIWIARNDGSGLANLTGGAFVNVSPFWGRDESIYFVSNRAGSDNIWSVRPRQAVMAAGGSVDRDDRGTNIAEVNENER